MKPAVTTHTIGSRQQGAALIVGLVLLIVLTILAVSGVVSATFELRMVRNTQNQERAFQAAEAAIEDALGNPVLSTGVAVTQSTMEVPNSPGDYYSYNLAYVGQTQVGTGMTGFSIGSAFAAYHFQVDTTGTSTDNALAQHSQSFYVIGPGT